jgi:hypothetical protein
LEIPTRKRALLLDRIVGPWFPLPFLTTFFFFFFSHARSSFSLPSMTITTNQLHSQVACDEKHKHLRERSNAMRTLVRLCTPSTDKVRMRKRKEELVFLISAQGLVNSKKKKRNSPIFLLFLSSLPSNPP